MLIIEDVFNIVSDLMCSTVRLRAAFSTAFFYHVTQCN